MNTKNALIFLVLVLMLLCLLLTIGVVNQRGINHELKTKLKEGVISNKKITPEIRLTTDGKTVDTLYIYKNK